MPPRADETESVTSDVSSISESESIPEASLAEEGPTSESTADNSSNTTDSSDTNDDTSKGFTHYMVSDINGVNVRADQSNTSLIYGYLEQGTKFFGKLNPETGWVLLEGSKSMYVMGTFVKEII